MYIRLLIHYYRPYKLLFLADMTCALVVCAVDLAFPQVLNWMLKHVFTREVNSIMRITVIVGISLLLLYLLRYACQYFIGRGKLYQAQGDKAKALACYQKAAKCNAHKFYIGIAKELEKKLQAGAGK